MAFHVVQSNNHAVYVVKPTSPIPKERAQEIGEYIEDLEKSTEITPQNLVNDAWRKDSKLHPFFEWDNKKAANKWREQQARNIINHFEIVVVDLETEEETTTRAWHSVTVVKQYDEKKVFETTSGKDDENGKEPVLSRVYVNVINVMSDEEKRRQVIDNALREIQGWRHRYSIYSELQPIFTAVDNVQI